MTTRWALVVLLFVGGGLCFGQGPGKDQPPKSENAGVPNLRELVSVKHSEMQVVVQRFEADREALKHTYNISSSPLRHARLKRFCEEWLNALAKLDADKLSAEAQADQRKLKETIERDLRDLESTAVAQAEIGHLLPFASTIIALEETRRRMEKLQAVKAAVLLTAMKKQIDQTRKTIEGRLSGDDKAGDFPVGKALLRRASTTTVSLRATLKSWFGFYNGYDPIFSWWMAEPYKDADLALESFGTFLRDKSGDGKDGDDKAAPRQGNKEPMPAVNLGARPGIEPDVPDLRQLLALPRSEMRVAIEKYQTDQSGVVGRLATAGIPLRAPQSAERTARAKTFYVDWLAALEKLDFDGLSHDGQIDYLLLRNHVQHERNRQNFRDKDAEELARLLPFEPAILDLDEARRQKGKTDPDKAVAALDGIKGQVQKTLAAVEAGLKTDEKPNLKVDGPTAAKAVKSLEDFRTTLKQWFEYHDRADPKWAGAVGASFGATDQALSDYATFLREKIAPARRDPSGIDGRPIGREALLVELAGEMIPYSPEELIAIANKELAWCEVEIKKASQEMGCGDDWHQAVEKVKAMHVEPGQQPEMIRDLALEAIDYVRTNDLVTVPPLAAETWRMEMMSPQRQLINPFFTGGDQITVSFPTNTMSHEAKLQSMRGNNIPFSRATVHHELIPGHNLQAFMTARYRSYRGLFGTAFWTEGWALYWEMVLYQKGFPKTAEDRVGFLFWRMHRCARIIFSLGYHLGKMSPQECIDFLVERVGHERDNATAEVRRSFVGSYGPLYQAAYMLGGLQIREMRRELVDTQKMSEREFHDAILQENRMPIALLRASLSQQKLTRDWTPDWKFYGEHP